MSNLAHKEGFTLIEVLVALLIFTFASVIAVGITQASVKAVQDSKDRSVATWLLQKSMTELETKLESEGIDKGCEKERKGKFEAPYDRFSYVNSCYEIDFKLSETASKLEEAEKDKDKDKDTSTENVIRKMILDATSDYMSKAVRELHSEVVWTKGKTKHSISVTTHFARYDQPLALPVGGVGP